MIHSAAVNTRKRKSGKSHQKRNRVDAYPVQHGTTELWPTQQPSSLPTISHSALNLRNGDQKTAADAKRVFMTRAKFVLVAWFEIPAESMLFGWPKHEVRGNLSTY